MAWNPGMIGYIQHIEAETKRLSFFANNIFDFIFVHVEYYILLQIALKFITQGPINNEPALVQRIC